MFVFLVLICAICLWLATELVAVAIRFVVAGVLARRDWEELPGGRLNLGRALMEFFIEAAAASLTHLLVASSKAFAIGKTRVSINVASTPILLIPGYFGNRGCWLVFIRLLRRLGASQVYTVDPQPMYGDIRDFAKQVGERVDAILGSTRASRVHLVGHSMGGLIARCYVEQLGGVGKVGVCVTIATPHHGSRMSRLAPGAGGKQMRPGSDFLEELNRFEHVSKATKLVSIWSTFDTMVVPASSAALGGNAKNVTLDYIGHHSMIYAPEVARLVWEELRD